MRSNVDIVTRTINKYLEKHSLSDDNVSWKIKKSDLGGYGLFTRRSIEQGEVIFKDHPVIIGPRSSLTFPVICANCYKSGDLKPCERKCGLQLCCSQCQNTTSHVKECKIIRQWQTGPVSKEFSQKLLLPIRSLLLSDEDKEVIQCLKAHKSEKCLEIDVMKNDLHLNLKEDEEIFMRFVSSVLDSNAFEVVLHNKNLSSVKGLYSLTSFVNHSCTPNAFYVFDDNQRMVAIASNFIPKDSEIFYSYTRFIWGTPTRRLYLHKTKHFLCKCERCTDPTEFGSYISAFLCKCCKKGRVIPVAPLIKDGKWICEDCGKIMDSQDAAMLSSSLGSILGSLGDEDLNYLLMLLKKKLANLVCENNETIVALKYKIIWILGHRPGYTLTDLSGDLLQIKEKFCKELLSLLETLKLGQCKMKGLLLYELYSCFKEMGRREEKSGNVSKVNKNHIRKLFLEAADILKYDAAAPNEIKEKWPQNI